MSKLPGARCDECSFKGQPCLPPRPRGNASLAIVESHPTKQNLEDGAYLVGWAGNLVRRELAAEVAAAHLTAAVACVPPWKYRPDEYEQARRCCAPRLRRELGVPELWTLVLGEAALRSLTGKQGLQEWFGFPLERVFPILDPRDTIGRPALLPFLKACLRRAGEWVRVRLAGKVPAPYGWPPIHLEESDAAFDLLKELAKAETLGFDVETAGVDPLADPLLAIGLGHHRLGGVSLRWPLRSGRAAALVADCLRGPAVKFAHNASHDVLALETAGFAISGGRVVDTLLQHVALFPQAPHDLGFCCAGYFNAPRWKAIFRESSGHKGGEVFTRAPHELLRDYNAKDCIMGDALGVYQMKLLKGGRDGV